jgi:hypothetical protein
MQAGEFRRDIERQLAHDPEYRRLLRVGRFVDVTKFVLLAVWGAFALWNAHLRAWGWVLYYVACAAGWIAVWRWTERRDARRQDEQDEWWAEFERRYGVDDDTDDGGHR